MLRFSEFLGQNYLLHTLAPYNENSSFPLLFSFFFFVSYLNLGQGVGGFTSLYFNELPLKYQVTINTSYVNIENDIYLDKHIKYIT
jgi:hypothetical protein